MKSHSLVCLRLVPCIKTFKTQKSTISYHLFMKLEQRRYRSKSPQLRRVNGFQPLRSINRSYDFFRHPLLLTSCCYYIVESPEDKLFSKTESTHRYELLNLYLNNTLYYYPARKNLLKLIGKSDHYFSFICFRIFNHSL